MTESVNSKILPEQIDWTIYYSSTLKVVSHSLLLSFQQFAKTRLLEQRNGFYIH